MAGGISSRPTIAEQAALNLRAAFEQADGRLEHWTKANAQQKQAIKIHINSMVHVCTPVVQVIGKLNDPAARHIAQSWPRFVTAWEAQKNGAGGNEAWEIMRNHLRNYVTMLVINA